MKQCDYPEKKIMTSECSIQVWCVMQLISNFHLFYNLVVYAANLVNIFERYGEHAESSETTMSHGDEVNAE